MTNSSDAEEAESNARSQPQIRPPLPSPPAIPASLSPLPLSQDPGTPSLLVTPRVDAALGTWGRQRERGREEGGEGEERQTITLLVDSVSYLEKSIAVSIVLNISSVQSLNQVRLFATP